jgi:hypothetical protein
MLGSKRGRERVRRALDHFNDLDPRFCRRIHGADSKPPAILLALRKLGAPLECHVISVSDDLDGRDMPLVEALETSIGRGQGKLISCVGGALGYFEGEGPDERYICHRGR